MPGRAARRPRCALAGAVLVLLEGCAPGPLLTVAESDDGITLAWPDGLDLDRQAFAEAQAYCAARGDDALIARTLPASRKNERVYRCGTRDAGGPVTFSAPSGTAPAGGD